MTRGEFMKTLLKYLKNLPQEELESIQAYYDELFVEAGISIQDQVPPSFGNPKRIALEILAESEWEREDLVKPKKRRSSTIAIIILAILAAPLGIPAIIALLGVIASVIIAVLAVIFGVGVAGLAPIVVLFSAKNLSTATIVFLLGLSVASIGVILLVVALGSYLIKQISRWVSRKTLEKKASNKGAFGQE